jgi:hypothetical protein
MSKILKNTTAFPISIPDTGVTIAASPATYTIPPQDYLLWAASNNIIPYIGSAQIIVNDGTADLGLADAVAMIQGHFPNEFKISDPNGFPIHSVVDGAGVRRLAIDVITTNGEATFKTIATPEGTSPVADSFADTLTLESQDGSINIIGNATTDTVNLEVDRCQAIRTALIFG